VELEQPGTEGVRQLGIPVKLSRTPGQVREPGPVLGADTHDVLAEAGYTQEEVEALEQSKAVAGPATTDARGSFMS
jgi:alpha-methylacyl-CoA racemase